MEGPIKKIIKFIKGKEKKSTELFPATFYESFEGDIAFVQMEYHPVLLNSKSIDGVIGESYERFQDGLRSKIVLLFQIDKKQFNLASKSVQAKELLHKMLLDKISKKERIMIERRPGSSPDYLRVDELHEIKEHITKVGSSNSWVFIFENSEEELMNHIPKRKMLYAKL